MNNHREWTPNHISVVVDIFIWLTIGNYFGGGGVVDIFGSKVLVYFVNSGSIVRQLIQKKQKLLTMFL